MPKCYHLVGVSGSGKTTWAKNQNWFSDCAYISSDKWIEFFSEQVGTSYSEVFHNFIETAITCMLQEVEVAASKGKDIIWDQTSISVNSRKKKFLLLPNYEHIAVVFNTPSDKELQSRLNSRPGKEIPSEVVKNMIKGFQTPSLDEGYKEIWYAV